MNTDQMTAWINLQTYFRLSLLGTNFLILGIILSIALLLSTFSVPFSFSLSFSSIFYALIGLILCNQFISIYFSNILAKKKTPSLRQIFLHQHKALVIQLFFCCLGFLYFFYFFEESAYFSLLYNLFFLLFCPAVIGSLLQTNLFSALNPIATFSFIFKDLFNYLFYLITLTLMGLGYKTMHYYATIWLPPEYESLANITLLAYLFLVSAYILSDVNRSDLSQVSNPDAHDLIMLKKHIASGKYDKIHDFFNNARLHTYSEDLLDFYLKFLFATQDEKKINTFCTQRLFILFQRNNIKKAVSVYELIFTHHSSFHLSDPLFNYTLAKKFILTKQFRIVLHLLMHVPKENPNFRNLPEVLLMLAKAYIGLNQDKMANQTLEEIIQNFPQSPYCSEAIVLQKILKINALNQKPELPK
jgi:tetratricopeptide (TPR) repeat protein